MVIIWDSEAHSMEQQTVIYKICVKKLPTNVDVLGNKDISCYVPRIALKNDFIVLLSFVRFYFHKKLKSVSTRRLLFLALSGVDVTRRF